MSEILKTFGDSFLREGLQNILQDKNFKLMANTNQSNFPIGIFHFGIISVENDSLPTAPKK